MVDVVNSPAAAELDSGLRAVAHKALVAGLALAGRQAFVLVLNALGALLLARLLPARIFGVYAVILFVQNACVILADAGLGASLIRRPEEPTRGEVSLVAYAQVAFAVALCFLAVLLHGLLPGTASDLGLRTIVLLVPVGLLFTVLQTPVLISLERDLRFGRIGLTNVAQSLVFNGIAILGAARGWGGASFGVAFAVQAFVGMTLLLASRRWVPARPAPLHRLRPMLAFGVPYQASTFLSLVKDFASPAVVGVLVGAAGVGHVEWATNLAAYALVALMVMQRIYLPAFARLQHDPLALGRAVSGAIRIANTVVAPLAVLTLALAPGITDVVFGHRWHTALQVFWWLWVANVIVPTVSPLYGLLNAVGRSRVTLGFTALWLGMTWALTVPLVHAFGIAGFGMANLGVQLSNFWLISVARRVAPFQVLRPAAEPWLVAAMAGAVSFTLSRIVEPRNVGLLAAELLAGGATYLFVLGVWQRPRLKRIVVLMRG